MNTTDQEIMKRCACVVLPKLDVYDRECLLWFAKGDGYRPTWSEDLLEGTVTRLRELNLVPRRAWAMVTDLGMAVADMLANEVALTKQAREVIATPIGTSRSFKDDRRLLHKIASRNPIATVPVLFFDLGLIELGDPAKNDPRIICTALGHRVNLLLSREESHG